MQNMRKINKTENMKAIPLYIWINIFEQFDGTHSNLGIWICVGVCVFVYDKFAYKSIHKVFLEQKAVD